MADPKDTKPAPKMSPAEQRRSPTIEEIQRETDKARRESDAKAPQRDKIAREAAQREIERLADEAIEWKRVRGKYPWEEPKTQIQIDNEKVLKGFEIDPDKPDEISRKVRELIRQRETQKKTGERGRQYIT